MTIERERREERGDRREERGEREREREREKLFLSFNHSCFLKRRYLVFLSGRHRSRRPARQARIHGCTGRRIGVL